VTVFRLLETVSTTVVKYPEEPTETPDCPVKEPPYAPPQSVPEDWFRHQMAFSTPESAAWRAAARAEKVLVALRTPPR